MEALSGNDPKAYHRYAQEWLSGNLARVYQVYIRERLERYDRLLVSGKKGQKRKPYATAISIWNLGLFFEFHEYLETVWSHTSGDEHVALKGFIKAAGVYVHLENFNRPAAQRLAPKARLQMKEHSHCLGFIANLEELLACLERPELPAPLLKYAEQ